MDFDEFIEETIRSLKGVKDYFYNKQLFIELYETKYGICDHINATNPLASVQFNDSEDYLSKTLYEGYLSTFIYRDLGKKLHMSFDDFINRPRHEIEMMIRVVEEADKKKIKINEGLVKDLEASTPKPTEE